MLKSIIANNLKRNRKIRQWSLSKAAIETTVSKAMLGQIERQESSPTILTMWKIAKGFHLPLSALIEQQPNCEILPCVDKNIKYSFDSQLEFQVLFAFDPIVCCEVFAHSLAANSTHLSNAHDTGVIEDIIVISGEFEMLTDGHWQSLKAGDTLRFCADTAHGYRNLTDKTAVFHNIIHYPKTVTTTEN
ncbi:MAG: XRE family transcriptional regulator [Oceanospirillaceae bacterium]